MPMPKGKRMPYVDYSGKKFTNLTILWAAGWRHEGKNSRIVWTCQCDCGSIIVAYTCDLSRGRIKSCGCRKIANHNANAMSLFSQYKNKAKERGYCWELTFDQFLVLTSSNCYYTGWKPSQVYKARGIKHEPYTWNGIDRVNNSIGYTVETAYLATVQ
jgi:hypothetical protein